MRAVVQRVTRASVNIEGDIVGEIGNGLVVLLSIARDDTKAHGLLKRRVRTGRNLLNETIELEPNYMPTHFLLALVRIQEKCLAEDLFRRVGFLN